MERMRFYDVTLRDGLRNSGVTIPLPDRVRLARALDAAGVDAIEVGFGGPHEMETIDTLARAIENASVFALTRPHRRDRERVLRALEAARRPGVNVFSPASDRFLGYMGWTRAEAQRRVDRAVRHLREHVAEVMFSVQDASGAGTGFAAELVGTAVAAGAGTVSVSDTASRALPAEFGALCAALRGAGVAGPEILWSVHCHDDLGLAVANVLAAIGQGARQAEVTVRGLGEGAGNAPLERVAAALAARGDAFPGLALSLDVDALPGLGTLLSEICRPAATGSSDVVGLLSRWNTRATPRSP